MEKVTKCYSIVFFALAVANATIINVPDDQPTIQAGINTINDEDTVLVQPGTYAENINFIGKNIVVGSLFLTTQDTTYISQTIIDGDSIGTVVTFNGGEDTTSVLSGFTITNGFGTYGGGINCQTSSPTLSNLTIINNVADSYGGGINCYNSTPILRYLVVDSNKSNNSGGGINLNSSDAKLLSLTISRNYAINYAGGLDCYRSSPIITNVMISGNSSGNTGGGVAFSDSANAIMSNVSIISNTSESSGGGISMWKSAPVIEDVEISENVAEGGGGGVVLWSSSPTLINCIISGNTTDSEGGGISCGGDSLVIINSIIHGNSASSGAGIQAYQSYIEIHDSYFTNNFQEGGHGAGIYLKDSTTAIVSNTVISGNYAANGGGIHLYNNFSSSLFYNCTIVDNHTDVGGGGITVGQNSSPIFVNSIFWNDQETDVFTYNGGTVTIAYSDIQGGWTGEGNINLDPLFVDAATGDYHLTANSPCIDAGISFFVFEGDTLVDMSEDEYVGSAPDMGAFEYGASGGVDDDFSDVPEDFSLFQNYPNPFNPVTTISYELPKTGVVRLSIYNIKGQLVETLVNEQRSPGSYSATWYANDVSSGLYFYKLTTENQTITKKMLLLK